MLNTPGFHHRQITTGLPMTQPELGDVSLRSPECWVSELAMMCLLSKHEFVFGILSENA